MENKEELKRFFKVKSIKDINDMKVGDVIEPSDYVVNNENLFVQLEYHNIGRKADPIIVEPGIYTAKYTSSGLQLFETEFSKETILESFVSTKEITDKIDSFIRNIDKYEEMGFDVAKRAILMHGPPGTGKTSSISCAIRKYTKSMKVVVFTWKTDVVEPDDIKSLFKQIEFKDVDLLFFIAEDIGGVEAEDARINSRSSLLSLLDNQEKTFKIPTLIIATTNFPEMFLANIANRPQRFDDKIKVGFPSAESRRELFKFVTKDRATEEDLNEITKKQYNEFTPAHLKEVLVRSTIYEKTFIDCMREMIKEIEQYNTAFTDRRSMGIT